MVSRVLAIDPGNIDSAYCILDRDTQRPLAHEKINNVELERKLKDGEIQFDEAAIEIVSSYGLVAGRDLFNTCIEIGRLSVIIESLGVKVFGCYRRDVKLHLTGVGASKDANVRAALIEMYAKHDFRNGKGTKANPDWWYKFRADEWAAAGLAVCFIQRGPSLELGGVMKEL